MMLTESIRPLSHWRTRILVACVVAAIWILEFAYQYYRLTTHDLVVSLIRSFALSAATLIGLALFMSVVFRWLPRTAQYWRARRYLGVSGALSGLVHALLVYYYYFNLDLATIYFSFSPIENPVVFGSVGLFIVLIMACTSTDWAVAKLTPRVWKFIHRFVYVAYVAIVFHFVTMNPALLDNTAGYLLIALTMLVFVGHFQLFIKTAWRKRFRSIGSWVGVAIIAGMLVTGYLARERLTDFYNVLFF